MAQVENGEVSVRLDIVGGDYEYLGQFSEPPIVRGRGIAGTVVGVGPGCPQPLAVGDKVAVKPLKYCSQCHFCRGGKYIECVGTRPQYILDTTVTLPAPLVTLLPPQLTLEEGALIQPLALAFEMIERANLRAEQGLVVFGASFIGIICCILARRRGLTNMMVVDSDEDLLGLVRRFVRFSGPGDNQGEIVEVRTCVVAAKTSEVNGAAVVEREFGRKADVCINATGDEELMKVAVKSVEDRGMYIHAKTRESEVNWDVYAMYNENITIDGGVGWGMTDFGHVVEMVMGGNVALREFCDM